MFSFVSSILFVIHFPTDPCSIFQEINYKDAREDIKTVSTWLRTGPEEHGGKCWTVTLWWLDRHMRKTVHRFLWRSFLNIRNRFLDIVCNRYCLLTNVDLFTDLKEFDTDFFHDSRENLQSVLHGYTRSELLRLMVRSIKSLRIWLLLFSSLFA